MVLAQFICERHGDVERKKRHGDKNSRGGNDVKKKRRKTTKTRVVKISQRVLSRVEVK